MNATIKLTRWTTAPNALPLGPQQVWPLRILATATDITDAIFVYRSGHAGDPFGGDQFSCIASVNQIYELPEDMAILETSELQVPFYRTNCMEVYCRNQDEAERIWQYVNTDVQSLINNWNAAADLQSTVINTITAGNITTTVVDPNAAQPAPTRIQLDYQPAGTATFDGNTQGLTAPDPTLTGWLPATSAPPGWVVPPNGAFFYNIALDKALTAAWPLNMPLSGNLLYRNGILLPYGVIYTITPQTIWWLTFDPSTVPAYARVGSVQDGNAPWPADYVNRSNLGTVSPALILTTN